MTVFVHGVGFNKDWVASMTLTKFRGHPSNAYHWPELSYSEKRNLLTKAHKLCTNDDNSGYVPESEDVEPTSTSAEGNIPDDGGNDGDTEGSDIFREGQI